MWIPHVVAWLLDVCLLTVVAAMLGAVDWALRRVDVRLPMWAMTSGGILLVMGLLLASYPALLTEFLAFPINVFRADTDTTSFFITEYLGWIGLWPLLIPCIAVAVHRRLPWPIPSRLGVLAIVVSVFLLSAATLAGPSPHPLVYSGLDFVRDRLSSAKRSVPSLTRPKAVPSACRPIRDTKFEDVKTPRYEHVLVMVLEGVTAACFEGEFLSRPNGYFARVRGQSVYFNNYYTTNLDSYTSLIAMLTSVQVPYRAYADASSYQAVNEESNLAAALKGHGFRTLYVCTAESQPFIPVRQDWTRMMHMRDLTRYQDWLAIGGSRVDAGVEDRAALPAIIDFMEANPKTFAMQEMIFGHSPRWTAKTGKPQIEYYDDYLMDLVDHLEKRNMADRVLLVVLSDHGDRARSDKAENYHVPLLITGRGIRSSRVSELYSHCDLREILWHFLGDRVLPKGRNSIITVGSTERWVYGEITRTGSHVFIDNDRGTVLAAEGIIDGRRLYDRFQSQVNTFAARYQR